MILKYLSLETTPAQPCTNKTPHLSAPVPLALSSSVGPSDQLTFLIFREKCVWRVPADFILIPSGSLFAAVPERCILLYLRCSPYTTNPAHTPGWNHKVWIVYGAQSAVWQPKLLPSVPVYIVVVVVVVSQNIVCPSTVCRYFELVPFVNLSFRFSSFFARAPFFPTLSSPSGAGLTWSCPGPRTHIVVLLVKEPFGNLMDSMVWRFWKFY